MALVVGEWHFPAGTVPLNLLQLAAALRQATGLGVRVEGTGGSAVLQIPKLREQLFDWDAEPGRLQIHGFAPAHPFLWEHLDAVLAAFGGTVGGGLTIWHPDLRHRGLRRPWSALSGQDRMLLRIPTILLARPFDRFLSRQP
jgi:hypothetical protein